jgi:hypothetical protein
MCVNYCSLASALSDEILLMAYQLSLHQRDIEAPDYRITLSPLLHFPE